MNYHELLALHYKFYNTHETKSLSYRIDQLIKLRNSIKKNENKILEALYKDLGKSNEESILTEVSIVLSDLDYTIKNLSKWAKPIKVKTPLILFPAKSVIVREPYGTVLIISPWNYPFQLTFNPLIGAIAAGNTAIIKPSPLSVNTSQIIKKIIDETFNQSYVSCILGDIEVANKLLELKTDYIFFTGSVQAGKSIMEKASKNLIPVTLELGGKSPVILDETYDIRLAAKRIAFGKLINAGQTCIAPDYLLIKEELVEDFIKFYFESVISFYSDKAINSDYYPKMITKNHLQRQISFIKSHHQVFGGEYTEEKMGPTLLLNVKENDLVMQEEIFGPILPIMTYKSLDEAIIMIKKHDKPLALYHFSNSKNNLNRVIKEISYGGATINDTLMHFVNHKLPFGGIGNSGMGAYHGKLTYETFSHAKPILYRGKMDLPFRYHPINKKKLKFLRKITK